MNKIILLFIIIYLGFGISYSYAEPNMGNMPSLAKEIKSALPDLFATEGFAAAAAGATAGWGELPGGIDIGVGIGTNRDITFASLGPTGPTGGGTPPPVKPPITPDTLGLRWLGMLQGGTITQEQYNRGINNFLSLPDERRGRIKDAYDNGNAAGAIAAMKELSNR